MNFLVDKSKNFAVDIMELCRVLKNRDRDNPLINQLLRSGTSIGANIHEGNYASSRDDFINKFQIALKECYETDYWLSIFEKAKVITQEEYRKTYDDCCKIRKLLISSINTAKNNKN